MNSRLNIAPAYLDSQAFALIENLNSALASTRQDDSVALYQSGLALCSHLLTHYQPSQANEPAQPDRVALAPWQERRAKELLAQSGVQTLRVSEVAARCALSRSHFSRAFKKNTGLSPRDWLLGHRIDKARQLLAETALSISCISQECGFADQSHFSRTFSRITGETPLNWRRQRRLLQAP